jgi:nucleotide-binding universal stress UspA family protein
MVRIERILVPVDFTETSDRAIAYATELASKLGASVTVMHAYQIPVYGFPEGAYIATAELAAQITEAAEKRLDEIARALRAGGVPTDTVLRDGVAWEEVNTVAHEVRADLIVIGTHGRRGLARALLGSVAENVIRTSSVPVLAIHGPREATS